MLHNSTLIALSPIINIDNGAGTVINGVLLVHSKAVRVMRAYIIYTTETAGTVAAGTIALGTTVAGAEVVAAANYVNSKTIGTTTALTLLVNEIPANTMLTYSHTGIATTAAGEVQICVEYAVHE